METLFQYFFWTSLYFFLLGAGYLLFVRPLKLPAFSRFFLLGGLLASLILGSGFLWQTAGSVTTGSQSLLLPDVVVSAGTQLERTQDNLRFFVLDKNVFIYLAAGVGAILFLRMLGSLVFLSYKISRSEKINMHGMRVVVLKDQLAPFSFHNRVFIPEKIKDDPLLEKILLHEKAHIRKKHFLDLVLLELLFVIFWFHPFIWFLRKEMKMIHEFEADRFVLSHSGNKTAYQQLLVNLSFSRFHFSLTNPLNYSPLKKRIMMMNLKTKTSRTRLFFGVIAVMAFFGTALFFQACNFNDDPVSPAETKEAVEEKASYEEEEIHTMVPVFPSFPGGEEGRVSFLQENLVYPEKAKEAGIQGTVFASFVVRSTGEITDVKILRGLSPEIDQEVIRVLELMPYWEPGRLDNDEPASVQFNMPVRFQLDEVQEEKSQTEELSFPEDVVIILDGEKIEKEDRPNLNDLVTPGEMDQINILRGEEAMKIYGYERVMEINRKKE